MRVEHEHKIKPNFICHLHSSEMGGCSYTKHNDHFSESFLAKVGRVENPRNHKEVTSYKLAPIDAS